MKNEKGYFFLIKIQVLIIYFEEIPAPFSSLIAAYEMCLQPKFKTRRAKHMLSVDENSEEAIYLYFNDGKSS